MEAVFVLSMRDGGVSWFKWKTFVERVIIRGRQDASLIK
jgi:hypothetical protein